MVSGEVIFDEVSDSRKKKIFLKQRGRRYLWMQPSVGGIFRRKEKNRNAFFHFLLKLFRVYFFALCVVLDWIEKLQQCYLFVAIWNVSLREFHYQFQLKLSRKVA